MAIITTIICQECNREAREMHNPVNPPPKVCSICQSFRDATAKDEHLHSLSQLPVEERLTKIEEWIYDYQHRKPPTTLF
jgi:hypothetical protein